MKSLTAIIEELSNTLETELQEGLTAVELSAEAAAIVSSAKGRRHKKTSARAAEQQTPSPAGSSADKPAPKPATPATSEGVYDTMEKIAAGVEKCQLCPLYKTRNRSVPGEGSLNPDIMFIGEAPGAEEDARGVPFVGRAGTLLTRMIEAMGYSRQEVFIGNVLKCRPPGNRTPSPEEMQECLPWLRAQIKLIKPKTIIALGTVAAQSLLNTSTKISQLRANWHAFEGIPLKATFHPSYLLRNPAAKRETWVDLQDVLKRLGREIPDHSKKSSKQ